MPFNFTGTGVDIYILADGVESYDIEFSPYARSRPLSRAANKRYNPPYPRWRCTKYGTPLAILTAGNYIGIAKKSKIKVLRYVMPYMHSYLFNVTYVAICVSFIQYPANQLHIATMLVCNVQI